MKFTTSFIASLIAVAPVACAPADAVSTRSSGQWTIKGMQRTCNSDDTSCLWSFTIDTGSGTTACQLPVKGSPASEANGGPATCGAFTVTSGWSGQFAEGFTTLSVVDYTKKLIVWPAYTDGQVSGGKVVVPDQSYTPQGLP